MLTLCLFTIALALLLTAWFYRFHQSTQTTQLQDLFTQRNVRFVAQPNAFIQLLRKIRPEKAQFDMIQKEGKVFGFKLLGEPTILCAEPQIAELVLVKEFTNFVNHRPINISDPFFANSIGLAANERWKRLRSVITPTFSAGKLRRLEPCFKDIIRTMLANFDDALKSSPDSLVNIKQQFGAFTMDTVIQVAFGVKVNSLVEVDNPLICHANRLLSSDMSLLMILKLSLMLTTPRLASWLGLRLHPEVCDYFEGITAEIIKKKRLEMAQEGTGKATCFVELLIEAEVEEEVAVVKEGSASSSGCTNKIDKYITTPEMMANSVFLLLAGYDTTATTMTLAAYCLALHPVVQEKLYDEIIQVLEKLAQEGNEQQDPIDLVTIESLSRFEYLNAVVCETLRLYTPAAMTERATSKDITLATADRRVVIHAKKGDIFHFPIYTMHRDPEQFPDPEAFRPERFLGGSTLHHRYAYLPFGSGPRGCIAKSLALLEVKLALLHTVRRYQFSIAKETKVPPEFYYNMQALIPKDIFLKVERR